MCAKVVLAFAHFRAKAASSLLRSASRFDKLQLCGERRDNRFPGIDRALDMPMLREVARDVDSLNVCLEGPFVVDRYFAIFSARNGFDSEALQHC